MAISLKHAMAVVIIEALNNNNGNIGYDDVSVMNDARKTAFAFHLMESPEFLGEFANAVETVINDHLDIYADEYGIE